MSVIRLSETMINQIAAGEVIERPASVVKELLENAIDAGATRVDLVTGAGGKNLIRVSDDGHGMSRQDLELAVERHCTSKLSRDLMDIRTLGFRGEALPSIGSVARLMITTRLNDSDNAWRVLVDSGKLSPPKPAALTKGTVIEVSSLFTNVPARLKFLKSDRAETNAITQVFKRIALAFPKVRFSISGSDRSSLDYSPTSQIGRISQILGSEFEKNALEIDAGREGFQLTGYAGLPTFNRGNAQHQYFFVNGRPVHDKSLFGAVRGAYSDFLPKERHGVLVLFLSCEPAQVDVNVHPAKSDVRFRDAGLVRGLIVGSLKQAISGAGFRSSSEGGRDMMRAFRPGSNPTQNKSWQAELSPYYPLNETIPNPNESYSDNNVDNYSTPKGFGEAGSEHDSGFSPSGRVFEPVATDEKDKEDWYEKHPLGAARAQLHKNYIIAQTPDGLMIIDQHAAHERIVYEKLKTDMHEGVASQILLIPDVIDLAEEDVERLLDETQSLAKFGLIIEKFGPGTVLVRETPAMLGEVNTSNLIQDLVDELAEWGNTRNLQEKLEHVAATIACHGSVRSGRILKTEEMNALLRQMEITPNSGQCNHGRPTYVELKLKDIERLFGR
ncbi:MAG: DNA mismatch repair endonuclease MutL [Hyphomicrobiales bacterium]|nr:DNA mismatch repair endonuclease MutL [Hyphomicrobiales bacterium]